MLLTHASGALQAEAQGHNQPYVSLDTMTWMTHQSMLLTHASGALQLALPQIQAQDLVGTAQTQRLADWLQTCQAGTLSGLGDSEAGDCTGYDCKC